MLPIIGIGDTLQYMTGCPDIRYKERVGNLTGDAQFAPYNPQRAVDYNLGIEFRDLETYFGSVVANFEHNSAISTLLGTDATKGDGQMSTPTARHVLARIDVSTPRRKPTLRPDREKRNRSAANKSPNRGLPERRVVQLAEARGYCELHSAEPRIFQRMA